MDALASSSHYIQQRLLPGIAQRAYTFVASDRPKIPTIREYGLMAHSARTTPDIVTMPQALKDNGYETVGVGKVYHP